MGYSLADEVGSSGTATVEPAGLTVLSTCRYLPFHFIVEPLSLSHLARLLPSEVSFMSGG